ncbi:MAG: hypothetical protein FWD71_12675 [Oscillospiraceae bacterium]|nr:hypothetical protein [Oscillospiraceae bacterium]
MSLAECVICANQLNEAVTGKTIIKVVANTTVVKLNNRKQGVSADL